MTMPDLDLGAIVNGGAFVVLAWLVRHTFQVTIPRLAADFRAALTEVTTAWREDLRAERDVVRGLVAEVRDLAKEVRELAEIVAEMKA